MGRTSEAVEFRSETDSCDIENHWTTVSIAMDEMGIFRTGILFALENLDDLSTNLFFSVLDGAQLLMLYGGSVSTIRHSFHAIRRNTFFVNGFSFVIPWMYVNTVYESERRTEIFFDWFMWLWKIFLNVKKVYITWWFKYIVSK